MPSRRHNSAMLYSPRSPSSTILIFSSAEWCFRVARRMFFTTCSDAIFDVSDFCLICASPESYDEPEILSSSSQPICLMRADAGHAGQRRGLLPSSLRLEHFELLQPVDSLRCNRL